MPQIWPTQKFVVAPLCSSCAVMSELCFFDVVHLPCPRKSSVAVYRPNSTWLDTFDVSARHVRRVETSVSSRAVPTWRTTNKLFTPLQPNWLSLVWSNVQGPLQIPMSLTTKRFCWTTPNADEVTNLVNFTVAIFVLFWKLYFCCLYILHYKTVLGVESVENLTAWQAIFQQFFGRDERYTRKIENTSEVGSRMRVHEDDVSYDAANLRLFLLRISCIFTNTLY